MKHTIQKLTLENGAEGLLVHVPDATVMSFEFSFRAGDYLVDPNKWEIAHIMEHMVLGANKKYPKARKFHAELEKNGAYSNASTSAYDITYISECADFEWRRVFDLLLLSIEQPLFQKSEFEAETGNVREELTGYLNNHFRQLVITSRDNFGFVSRSDQDRLVMIDSITLEDIEAHYKKTHHSANLRFVIAGNLESERAKAIEQRLEQLTLERGTRFELPDETPKTAASAFTIEREGVDNLFFLLNIFLHRRLEQREEDALTLLNTMLTSTFDSKVFGAARERGLTYDISSSSNAMKSVSDWWFAAQIRPDSTPALFEIIKTELQNILDGKLTEADLESARQYSIGKYQRGTQTVGSLLRGYSDRYFFDNRVDDFYAVPERIKAITKEDVTNVARDFFAEGNSWGLSTLGSSGQQFADTLHEQIAQLWR